MRILCLFILTLLLYTSKAQNTRQVNIIPYPSSVKINKGSFSITKQTVIAVDDEGDRKAAEFLKDYLQQYYGLALDIDKKEGKNYIRLFTKKIYQSTG